MSHQFRGFDFGPCGDDFALADPLGLRGHAERFLQFVAEDNVLDEHAFDLHAPANGDVFDDFANGLRDFFAALNDVLQDARADHVPQGGLRAFHEGGADVGDAERGFVRARDVVVYHRCELDADVILGHTDLLGDLDDLDLDIDFGEAFAEWVDAYETGIDGTGEAPELSDEPDVALFDGSVWVGADDAAGDSATETNEGAEGVDCRGTGLVQGVDER